MLDVLRAWRWVVVVVVVVVCVGVVAVEAGPVMVWPGQGSHHHTPSLRERVAPLTQDIYREQEALAKLEETLLMSASRSDKSAESTEITPMYALIKKITRLNQHLDTLHVTLQKITELLDAQAEAPAVLPVTRETCAAATEFACDEDKCLPRNQVCDGVADCVDGTDETQACPVVTRVVCESEEFLCEKDHVCINTTWLCDGDADCTDGSDERNCTYVDCEDGYFLCASGVGCASENWKCDGENDCIDGSDETNCNQTSNTTSAKPSYCSSGQFECVANGECINLAWKCDGDNDCSDASDEYRCEKHECAEDRFACASGNKCIYGSWRCDGDDDCLDGSDEAKCHEVECSSSQLRCDSGDECYSSSWKCDGSPDCHDESDEFNCSKVTCAAGEFACRTGGRCLPPSWRCDGEDDCLDSSDEQDCHEAVCSETYFKCVSGEKCIKDVWRCDGEKDCFDGTDELDCHTTLAPCGHNEFRCVTDGKCLLRTAVCDGVADCSDASDEEHCTTTTTTTTTSTSTTSTSTAAAPRQSQEVTTDTTTTTTTTTPVIPGSHRVVTGPEHGACAEDKFECVRDKTCIDARWRCDGEDDCDDHSDEVGCVHAECEGSYLMCNSGDECVHLQWLCDGDVDCFDASDEKYCNSTVSLCRPGEHQCKLSGKCVPQALLCDGFPDCPDGGDEEDCSIGTSSTASPSSGEVTGSTSTTSTSTTTTTTTSSPSSGEVTWPYFPTTKTPTTSTSTTTSSSTSGEVTPPSIINTRVSCVSRQFQCESSGECLSIRLMCDGHQDCNDRTDERRCHQRTCTTDQYRCHTGACIPAVHKCDGIIDCTEGDDEANCNEQSTCGSDGFKCRTSGTCVSKTEVCDGKNDCPDDGSDESDCPTSNPTPVVIRVPVSEEPIQNKCPLGDFACLDTGRCIEKSWQCDGHLDCMDGSDELSCTQVTVCQGHRGFFRCLDGSGCIGEQQVCDGLDDCGDSSDEGPGCSTRACGEWSCSHGCFATPSGFQCTCPVHLTLDHTGTVCVGGLPSSYVLVGRQNALEAYAIDGSTYFTVFPGKTPRSGVIAVTYDPVEDIVYWSMMRGGGVYRQDLMGNRKPQLFVETGNTVVESIAVDWLGRNLYLVGSPERMVRVCSLEAGVCAPLIQYLPYSSPRALRLDLFNRRMFWSDWRSGTILRSDLDGSGLNPVMEGLRWPNGLALDRDQQRVYWMDALRDSLEYMHYDGTGRTEVRDGNGTREEWLKHPYSLDLYADSLYFTDWARKEVLACEKHTCSNVTSLTGPQDSTPFGVAVIHPGLLEGMNNPCQSKPCDRICVLSAIARAGYTCL